MLVSDNGESYQLRSVGLGEDCAAILDAERREGSRFKGSSPSEIGDSILMFSGTHGNREAEIAYFCRDGSVISVGVNLSFASDEEAGLAFGEYESALSSQFGPGTPSPGTRFRRYLSWLTSRFLVFLTLSEDSPVVVSVSQRIVPAAQQGLSADAKGSCPTAAW